MKRSRPRNFDEFWYFYLNKHTKPMTRAMHIVGTLSGAGLFIFGAVTMEPLLVVAAICVGYGFAVSSHYLFEGNRPATPDNPLYAMLCDFKMVWYWLTGRLTGELVKAGVDRGPERQ